MRIIIILIFLPIVATSQVVKTEDGDYLVKQETLSRLDQAAKKYIQCAVASDSMQLQFNILDSIRIIKDNVLIEQQKRINKFANSVMLLEGENILLKKINADLKIKTKEAKKSSFWWKVFGMSAIAFGTFIATR